MCERLLSSGLPRNIPESASAVNRFPNEFALGRVRPFFPVITRILASSVDTGVQHHLGNRFGHSEAAYKIAACDDPSASGSAEVWQGLRAVNQGNSRRGSLDQSPIECLVGARPAGGRFPFRSRTRRVADHLLLPLALRTTRATDAPVFAGRPPPTIWAPHCSWPGIASISGNAFGCGGARSAPLSPARSQ